MLLRLYVYACMSVTVHMSIVCKSVSVLHCMYVCNCLLLLICLVATRCTFAQDEFPLLGTIKFI